MTDTITHEREQEIIEQAYHLYESGEVGHYDELPNHLLVNTTEAKRIEDGLMSAGQISVEDADTAGERSE